MKPSWKDAPEWAKWVAMDSDGVWMWFEFKPYKEAKAEYLSVKGGRCEAMEFQNLPVVIEKRPAAIGESCE